MSIVDRISRIKDAVVPAGQDPEAARAAEFRARLAADAERHEAALAVRFRCPPPAPRPEYVSTAEAAAILGLPGADPAAVAHLLKHRGVRFDRRNWGSWERRGVERLKAELAAEDALRPDNDDDADHLWVATSSVGLRLYGIDGLAYAVALGAKLVQDRNHRTKVSAYDMARLVGLTADGRIGRILIEARRRARRRLADEAAAPGPVPADAPAANSAPPNPRRARP